MLVALSINHIKTPVVIREKIAFSQTDISTATVVLNNHDQVSGNMIVSTCNRLEIYASICATQPQEILIQFLKDYHHITKNELDEYLEYYTGEEAIDHLCQVASGLHSLVVGEPQILGQLKHSYNISKQQQTLNSDLENICQHAFSVAKTVRTTTDIGKNPVSIAFLAVKLSQKIFANLSKQVALLIGSGEMIELSAKHLVSQGIQHLIIANRTTQNAQKIIAKLGNISAQSINLKQLYEYFHLGDIVISSTAAQMAIIGKGLVETSMKQRKHKPVFILDLAIPRDVETQVADLNDVFLYTVDDLKQVIEENTQNRAKTKKLALQKITQLNTDFIRELNKQEHTNIIKNYHQKAQALKTMLISEALKDLKVKNPEAVITKLADQLTNKLIHRNLRNIKILDQHQINQCQQCVPDIQIDTK